MASCILASVHAHLYAIYILTLAVFELQQLGLRAVLVAVMLGGVEASQMVSTI